MIRLLFMVVTLAFAADAQQAVPQSSAALIQKGLGAEKAGHVDQAVEAFRELLRGAPTRAVAGQARLELLRIFERRGNWWEAADQLRELRKLAPMEAEYAYQLGVVYRNLAKSAYEQLRAAGPDSGRFQQMLGEQLGASGDTEKAVAAFQRAIAADPKLAGSHLALSIIYLRMNKRAEALAEIGLELAVAPESAIARQVRQAVSGVKP